MSNRDEGLPQARQKRSWLEYLGQAMILSDMGGNGASEQLWMLGDLWNRDDEGDTSAGTNRRD